MGYCVICSDYTGFGGDYLCDECYNLKKIVSVYGIERVNKTINAVFVRKDEAVENRTDNIDRIITKDTTVHSAIIPYDLRKKKTEK